MSAKGASRIGTYYCGADRTGGFAVHSVTRKLCCKRLRITQSSCGHSADCRARVVGVGTGRDMAMVWCRAVRTARCRRGLGVGLRWPRRSGAACSGLPGAQAANHPDCRGEASGEPTSVNLRGIGFLRTPLRGRRHDCGEYHWKTDAQAQVDDGRPGVCQPTRRSRAIRAVPRALGRTTDRPRSTGVLPTRTRMAATMTAVDCRRQTHSDGTSRLAATSIERGQVHAIAACR